MLKAHGLAVQAPPAWDVRVYRRSPTHPQEQTFPVLHGATFALPARRGDYGSGAVELMRPTDVLVALVEQEPAAARTPLFARGGMPTARPEDFSPRALQRTLRGQSGAQYFFHSAGRAFCLYVVLGSHARRRRLVPEANRLAAAVAIG